MDTADSTTFILQVQDKNLIAVDDALIFIQKFYPGDGIFRTVQIAKTDDNGKTVGFFEVDTVLYRFIIVKNNVVLLTTEPGKISPETSPLTLIFTLGEGLSNLGSSFGNFTNLFTNLSVDRDTNVVTYTYIDTSGTTQFGRLLVDQALGATTTTICNINSTQASATLLCNVTGFNGTVIAKSFISRSPEVNTGLISFVTNTLVGTLGILGVFFGIFIIMVAGGAFVIGLIPGIVAVNAAVIITNLTGLVSFGALYIFAMLGISAIIIAIAQGGRA